MSAAARAASSSAGEPLRGWRVAEVTPRRTKLDWALFVRELMDVHCAEAERVVLVMDNLNTHHPASLYEAFPPAEAARLANDWKSTTHPNTAAGSTSPRAN